MARSVQELIAGGDMGMSLRDLAYSAGARRGHHDHRLALLARTPEEMRTGLAAFLNGEPFPGLSTSRRSPAGRPRLAFVFSGQGTQWRGMGLDLLASEPVFRDVLERCDGLLAEQAGWSLLAELTADESSSRLSEPRVVQPALFAIQAALTALWRSWGIVPDAVVGHSLGEVAAAHAAGVLDLPDALRIAFHRGRLMQQVAGRGETAAVELPLEEARRLLARHGDRLAIAAINGPTSTTISGDPDAVREVVSALKARGVFAHEMGVGCAFHGPQMDAVRRDLEGVLVGLRPGVPAVPMVSTVTGRVHKGRDFDAAYWGRNLRETVRFAEAMDTLVEGEGCELFLEVGPHPALSGAVSESLRRRSRSGVVLPSLRRGEDGRGVLLGSLGALYSAGLPVAWQALYPSGRRIELPPYPGSANGTGWNRKTTTRLISAEAKSLMSAVPSWGATAVTGMRRTAIMCR